MEGYTIKRLEVGRKLNRWQRGYSDSSFTNNDPQLQLNQKHLQFINFQQQFQLQDTLIRSSAFSQI